MDWSGVHDTYTYCPSHSTLIFSLMHEWVKTHTPPYIAKDSRCLCKFIHCEGESTINFIITSKWFFLDKSPLEIESKTPNESSNAKLEWIGPQSCSGTIFYWGPFIHNRWVYIDSTIPHHCCMCPPCLCDHLFDCSLRNATNEWREDCECSLGNRMWWHMCALCWVGERICGTHVKLRWV